MFELRLASTNSWLFEWNVCSANVLLLYSWYTCFCSYFFFCFSCCKLLNAVCRAVKPAPTVLTCSDQFRPVQCKVEEGELVATKKRESGEEEAVSPKRNVMGSHSSHRIFINCVIMIDSRCHSHSITNSDPGDLPRTGDMKVHSWFCLGHNRKCFNTSAGTTLVSLPCWRTSRAQHPWKQRPRQRFARLTASLSRCLPKLTGPFSGNNERDKIGPFSFLSAWSALVRNTWCYGSACTVITFLRTSQITQTQQAPRAPVEIVWTCCCICFEGPHGNSWWMNMNAHGPQEHPGTVGGTVQGGCGQV